MDSPNFCNVLSATYKLSISIFSQIEFDAMIYPCFVLIMVCLDVQGIFHGGYIKPYSVWFLNHWFLLISIADHTRWIRPANSFAQFPANSLFLFLLFISDKRSLSSFLCHSSECLLAHFYTCGLRTSRTGPNTWIFNLGTKSLCLD